MAIAAALCCAVPTFAPYRAAHAAPAVSQSRLEAPTYPAHTGPVVDAAHLLSAVQQEQLAQRLRRLREETGVQLVVATVPALQDEPIESFALALCEQWRLGRKGQDDGVLLLVAPTEKRARIEVGYGLEDVLPDIVANQLLAAAVADSGRGLDGAAIGHLVTALELRLRAARKGQGDTSAAPPGLPQLDPEISAWGGVAGIVLLGFVLLWASWGRRRMQAQPFRPLRPEPGARGRFVGQGGGGGALRFILLALLNSIGRGQGRGPRDNGPDDRGGGGGFGGGGASGRW